MAGKLADLQKRLARVEQTLANLAKREDMASCICQEVTVAFSDKPDEFEAEMNRACPVHGFRRLGRIVSVGFAGGTVEENAKLDQLMEIYRGRRVPTKLHLSQLRWVARKIKHDTEER